MVAAQVMGLDAAIAVAGQSGNFQLNVMLPLIANNLLRIHSPAGQRRARARRRSVSRAPNPNVARLDEALARNPILATALNPVIGYERAAAIAKRAYAEGRPVFDVALEMSGLPRRRTAPPARSGGAHARRTARRWRPGLSGRAEVDLRARILAALRRHRSRAMNSPTGACSESTPNAARRLQKSFSRRTRCRPRCWCRWSTGPRA